MVFSSITFLFYFLPLFLFAYLLSPRKNYVLLGASLLFYAWGEVEFVLVMLVSCFLNYLLCLFVGSERRRVRDAALAIGVAANLGLLVAFKYAGFFADTFNAVAGRIGLPSLDVGEIHLPLGISFFTFQAMSYLIDVYRGQAQVERNPLHVALYISMFPQLIAGPIVRFQTVAEAIRERTHSVDLFTRGIQIFAIGMGQKVLVANPMARVADGIFALPTESLSALCAWVGALAYTLQIYFDFGGYSNMAIGLGLMLGFHFPKNFEYPYIAQSVTDFWKRWHISLSTWFRDYLYIPLGGNRRGPLRTYLNLWVVFFLCGLWHGASWSFVLWGCYHGLVLVIERLRLLRALDRLPRLLRHVYTLLAVIVGWVIFRAETLPQALGFLRTMAGLNGSTAGAYSIHELATSYSLLVMAIGAVASTPLLRRVRATWRACPRDAAVVVCPRCLSLNLATMVYTALLLAVSAMSLAAGGYNPFIYFRF